MNPNLHKHIYAAVAILLIGIAIIAAYVQSKVNVAQFKQVQKDEKPVHQEAQQQIQSAQKSEDSNQKALAIALAALAAQRQEPVDYGRLQQMIDSRLAGLQVKVEGPAKDASGKELPDAPSSVTISGVGAAKQINDAILGCDESKVRLNACEQSVTNTESELLGEKKDHAATKAELAAAKKAAKGGGFFARLKSGLKIAGITAVGTVAAVCGTGHCK